MRILDLAFIVPIVSLVPACHSPATKPDAAEAKTEAPKDDADEEKESKADKIAKKTRALEDARLELTIARMECESADRKAKDAVEEAEREVKVAREALDEFLKVEKPLELSKVQFNLDRSKWGVEIDKQELEELMAMYKKDDVATLTRELVIGRGQKKLEFGNRDLAHDQIEASMKTDYELPKKQKELEAALKKAENGLREAKADQQKQTNENELKLRKSEHEVDDLKKEVDKLNAKKDAKVAMATKSVTYGAF